MRVRPLATYLPYYFISTSIKSHYLPAQVLMTVGLCTLDCLMAPLPFDEASAMYIAASVVLGLEHLHWSGVIYRGLSVHSVVVTEGGQVGMFACVPAVLWHCVRVGTLACTRLCVGLVLTWWFGRCARLPHTLLLFAVLTHKHTHAPLHPAGPAGGLPVRPPQRGPRIHAVRQPRVPGARGGGGPRAHRGAGDRGGALRTCTVCAQACMRTFGTRAQERTGVGSARVMLGRSGGWPGALGMGG